MSFMFLKSFVLMPHAMNAQRIYGLHKFNVRVVECAAAKNLHQLFRKIFNKCMTLFLRVETLHSTCLSIAHALHF